MVGEGRHREIVEKLYRQRAWLVMLANSYLQDMEVSDDIVNDSFISLWENIDGLEERVLKAWLATTVKNRCLNFLKRRESEQDIHRKLKKRASDAENISILENDKMDFRMFSNEVQNICRESIEKMEPISSKVFIERLRGMSYKEIAEKYGITQRSVTYEVSKVLAVLKVALKDYLPMFLLIVSTVCPKMD